MFQTIWGNSKRQGSTIYTFRKAVSLQESREPEAPSVAGSAWWEPRALQSVLWVGLLSERGRWLLTTLCEMGSFPPLHRRNAHSFIHSV